MVGIDDDDNMNLTTIEDYDDQSPEDDYIYEAENPKTTSAEQQFTFLNESDIQRLQEADITEISSVLSIPRVAACLLLHHYNWSVAKVHEAWFDDEAGAREAVGLLEEPLQVLFSNSKDLTLLITCDICFETLSCIMFKSAACGHPYCITCWKYYVDTNIDEGPRCLSLRCPEPSCVAAVDGDMICEFACETNRDKYDMYLLRSYVENSKKMKWCPGPACDFAVCFEAGGANWDVTCPYYHSFCWNCGEDAHSPVSCETVDQWIKKNISMSNCSNWILAYTKPCPQCKKPIEKSQGCMHMTCRCGFHFCWLCLRSWSACGDYKSCNRFANQNVENFEEQNQKERERKNTRIELERYAHYYERWTSNDFSRKNALENLRELNAKHLKRLSAWKPGIDLKFISVAWLQVVECRRVLKWTYAYGYYFPENEKAKKEFFEHKQGEAEVALERLHHCAEKELRKFLHDNGSHNTNTFDHFRLKLIHLTSATKTYFENLVRELENGLADVHVSNYTGVKRESSEKGESSKRRVTRKRTINIDGLTRNDPWQCAGCGNYNVASAMVCQFKMCPYYDI